MKIATWNVNSIRARLPRVLDWLAREAPDIVCLQETKVVDEDFPAADLQALGYGSLVYGQPTYNGVAIVSRRELQLLARGFPGQAGSGECRLLAARVADATVVSVYVPNGKEIGTPAYAHKLDWLNRLGRAIPSFAAHGEKLIIAGDFNVAPEDRDVHDPDRWRGRLLCGHEERETLAGVVGQGLIDLIRLHHPGPGPFTWWDYRGGAFHRGWGLRIDHLYASAALAELCVAADTHREERKGEKPSDHVPVVAEFREADRRGQAHRM